MRVTSHQDDKQTLENCGWVGEKKENLKCWKVLKVSKLYLPTWEIIVSLNSKKENQLVITKKNNEHDQKLTEIVVGDWVQ